MHGGDLQGHRDLQAQFLGTCLTSSVICILRVLGEVWGQRACRNAFLKDMMYWNIFSLLKERNVFWGTGGLQGREEWVGKVLGCCAKKLLQLYCSYGWLHEDVSNLQWQL